MSIFQSIGLRSAQTRSSPNHVFMGEAVPKIMIAFCSRDVMCPYHLVDLITVSVV